ncbi:MAG: hypothetical protein AAGA55_01860 [Planctomycetota bacterium]
MQSMQLKGVATSGDRCERARGAKPGQRGRQGPRQHPKTGKPDPESDELADRRAKVSALVAEDRLDEAADAYRSLLDAFAHRPGAGTLSRDAQLKLVGHLLASGDRKVAALGLQGFLGTYPNDPERHTLAILLARVYANDLGEPEKARALLKTVAEQVRDPDSRSIAQEELHALPPEDAS